MMKQSFKNVLDMLPFLRKRELDSNGVPDENDTKRPRLLITTAQVANDCFNWKVPVGNGISSLGEPFMTFGSQGEIASTWQFQLKCFQVTKTDCSLGLFIRPIEMQEVDKESSVHGTFAGTILHPSDSKKNICFSGKKRPFDPAKVKNWGVKEQFSLSTLEDLVHSDKTLSVNLEFNLFKQSMDDAAVRQEDVMGALQVQNVQKCMNDLFGESLNKDSTDVEIKTKDEKVVRFHSYVLRARSKILRDKLNAWKEEHKDSFDGEYKLTVNLSGQAVRFMICHIYHGCLIPNLMDPEEVSDDLFREVVQGAEEYGFAGLREYLQLRENGKWE